jgi:two-component system cell cycle sensor histidine kinase/response regulator CckA
MEENKTNKKIKVLVVEDERIVAKDIQNTLKNLGYEVVAISSTGEDAIEKSKDQRPDIVLMDIVLKGSIDGIEAAKKIKTEFRIPIIYLTAYEDSDTLARAKLTEPLGYILKPFEERDLHTTLEMALYKHIMESKLQESEEKYRRLVELSPDGIIVQYEGKITFANESAAILLREESVEKIIGASILDFIPKHNHEIFNEKIKFIHDTQTTLPFLEEQFCKKDGTNFEVEVAIVPFIYEKNNAKQIIFRDITERKKAQEELRKAYEEIKETHQALINAEKLAALGRFSAGIAHEIRNPLANISASAQFCISKFEMDEKMRKHFDVILRNTDTANRIIKELLDFTSPKESSMSEGNIATVIEHVCRLVNPRCSSENIKVIKKIDHSIPAFPMNEKKLEDAFLNFLSNAIESMPNGGDLIIIAEKGTNNHVIVKIKDTGIGISEENMDKVLEPFFTTKDNGTGLGLSLAYNVLKSHSAMLNIESKPGNGTIINIEFPQN